MKRYLSALIAYAGLVIVTGAVVTNGYSGLAWTHTVAGVVLGVLMLPLMRVGLAGWVALALAALENISGTPIFHACLAPAILAALVFLGTEPPAEDRPRDGLAWLAIILPPLVLLQVSFGAAYRHKVWDVMPHMGGAMLVATCALILCVLLHQRRPDMKVPAMWVMSIVLTQIALGIASFILRLLEMDKEIWFTATSTAHVLTGSATLAATTGLARRMGVPFRRKI